MQMTGPKTQSIFERFAIVSDGDLWGAARSMDAFTTSAVGKGQSLGAATITGAAQSSARLETGIMSEFNSEFGGAARI